MQAEQAPKSAQELFNETYISSAELCSMFKIQRSILFHARKRGELPDAISVPGVRLFFWERDKVQPHLAAFVKRRAALHRPYTTGTYPTAATA